MAKYSGRGFFFEIRDKRLHISVDEGVTLDRESALKLANLITGPKDRWDVTRSDRMMYRTPLQAEIEILRKSIQLYGNAESLVHSLSDDKINRETVRLSLDWMRGLIGDMSEALAMEVDEC